MTRLPRLADYLGQNQIALLHHLAKGPAYILEVAQALDVCISVERANLRRLVRRGLVRSETESPRGGRGRPREIYSLTRQGREALRRTE